MKPSSDRDRDIQRQLDGLVVSHEAEIRGVVLLVHYEDGNVGIFQKLAPRLVARARAELQTFGMKAIQKVLSWYQSNSRQ